jgi:RNA polymerase sigma-70 factor (ECF subfamily)
MQMADFEATYRTHVEAVFRYALRVTANRELAEDITSEAFLELYRNWGSMDLSRLPGWLLTVVKNKAIDYWRKSAVERRYVESSLVVESTPASEPGIEHWLLEEQALKPIHRACLVMHFVHGMSRSEVGERLGLSETQVKGHLQYALRLLRKAWTSVGDRERQNDESGARRTGTR